MTTDNQPISAAQAAEVAAVLASLGPVAVVRMVPVTVATAYSTRRRTEVFLFDADGVTLHGRVDEEGHALARDAVRAAFPGRVWDRAYDYYTTGWLTEVAALRVPPEPRGVLVLPLAVAADVGALLEQRHQLEDPAEPPLAVADLARDCARSLAEGHMDLPDWGDPAPTQPCSGCGESHAGDPDRCKHCTGCGTDHDPADCGYRPTVGVPVQGGAL